MKLAYYEGTIPGRSVGHSSYGGLPRHASGAALWSYRANKAFYDELLAGTRSGESGDDVSASVLLI